MTPTHDPDAAYRTIGAFFATLASGGVDRVVISPGSRSTPLTVVADAVSGLDVDVMLDERVAGFYALGRARASGRPVVLVCTSGTAAANYLPAVVEAHYSRVPLIVCTADRPPELRDRGAGQTIDQVGLYGSHARYAVDLPVASDVGADFGRTLALRVLHEGAAPPGPVHCNFPLREPLLPGSWTAADLPEVRPAPARPRVRTASAPTSPPPSRGLLVVGPGDFADAGADIVAAGRALAWPVLAEATSSIRTGPHVADSTVLAHWDLLLSDEGWTGSRVPDHVVRVGGPPTSKALRLFLERHQVPLTTVDHHARFDDPSGLLVDAVASDPVAALAAMAESATEADPGWAERWVEADRRLQKGVAELVDAEPLNEIGVVRAIGAALPDQAALYVSNSMPVRDVDGFLPLSDRRWRVFANRGASGIDGVTASALGVASLGVPTVLLTGDIAFTHDIGALHAGVRAGLDLTIVVPDNGGGGIFDFLPVASHPDIDHDTLFITPSHVDWQAVAAIGGVTLHEPTGAEDLQVAVADAVGRRGIDVIRVATDRAANVDQHHRLRALVADLGG